MNTPDDNLSYASLLRRLAADLKVLPDKPNETPEATLTCLWALAAGEPIAISQAASFACQALDDTQSLRLKDLVEQRLADVPLAHLTGRQEFMQLVMLASPAALVPRKETELLGFTAVNLLRQARSKDPLVVDVCTGAGNVALGVASHFSAARVLGSDISAEAVALAKLNAAFLGRRDVEFRCGDLLEPFRESGFLGKVDLLTCNPPYISSSRVEAMAAEISRHEPRLAFDGGPFGVGLIRRFVKEAPDFLTPGGWLAFEVGLGQGAAVARGLERNAVFDRVQTQVDENGEIRVVAAQRAQA